jgi:hypothetical protein
MLSYIHNNEDKMIGPLILTVIILYTADPDENLKILTSHTPKMDLKKKRYIKAFQTMLSYIHNNEDKMIGPLILTVIVLYTADPDENLKILTSHAPKMDLKKKRYIKAY